MAINKIQTIQRCVRRARQEYEKAPDQFATNYTQQDAALLNVVRACETAIDLANHLIRGRKLGIPVSSRNTFELLVAEGIIESGLAEKMKKMVGFRNMVVHQYTTVDLAIVVAAMVTGLNDILKFADQTATSL